MQINSLFILVKLIEASILEVMNAILAIAQRSLKNSGLQRDSRYRSDALTNWAMNEMIYEMNHIQVKIWSSIHFMSFRSLTHSSPELLNPQITSSHLQRQLGFIAQLGIAGIARLRVQIPSKSWMFRALFAITKIAFITATITAITSFHVCSSIYDSFHISCRSLVKLLFLHVSICCFYEMIQFQASRVICQRSVFFNTVSGIWSCIRQKVSFWRAYSWRSTCEPRSNCGIVG